MQYSCNQLFQSLHVMTSNVNYVYDVYCRKSSVFVFLCSMSHALNKKKLLRGWTVQNNLAKNVLRISSVLHYPQGSHSKYLPMVVSRLNHAHEAESRSNHLPDVTRPYARYSKTQPSSSLQLPKIHKSSEPNTDVPAHMSTKIHEEVLLSDTINCPGRRGSVSPWYTPGQRNTENEAQLFSLEEFLEQCSLSTEEHLYENSSNWDSSMNGSFRRDSKQDTRCFPRLPFWQVFDNNGPLTRYVNCGLCMHREFRERFPRHRLQRKLVSDPGMHHGTCVTHVPWYMSGSLARDGRENVPGIPDACTTGKSTYLVKGPWNH